MDVKKEIAKCSEDELDNIMLKLDMGSYDHETKEDLIQLILAYADKSKLIDILLDLREA